MNQVFCPALWNLHSTSAFTCFVFPELYQGTKVACKTNSRDTFVLHADISQEEDAHELK